MSTKKSKKTAESSEDFAQWDASQVASYLRRKADLGDYEEMLIQHKITGEVAPHLADKDLKEMGISSIGDRKRFLKAVSELQKHHRKQEREKVLWQDEQVLYFSCWQAACQTCCGCCPADPSQYTLTGNHLIIKTVKPCRIGPVRCCCHTEYDIDNVDLTHVTDADVKGVPAPCCQQVFCCGKAQDHVIVKTTSDGTKVLVLTKGQGQEVARKILNQVEEAQKMERD